MVEYDDKMKNLYNTLFEDTSKYEEVLNESSIVLENYLRIILKITNMNLRHLPKRKIKYLCDIYNIQQCCWRVRHTSAENIDTVNDLWDEIKDILEII